MRILNIEPGGYSAKARAILAQIGQSYGIGIDAKDCWRS
jgi:hypothetical protein